jgi:putative SOS response-associated peptidase YedK
MCGRFTNTRPRLKKTELALKPHIKGAWPDLQPRYNISPGTQISAIRLDVERGATLDQIKWGLLPHWSNEPKIAYNTINAMAETVDTKASYRTPFKKRRCLIPADGWFEWQVIPTGKQKWWLHMKDGSDFCFAGLWDRWHRGDQIIESCTIIVTNAAESIKHVHDRMPVILDPKDYEFWLDPEVDDVPALKELLQPAPDQLLAAHQVANPKDPRDDDVRLIDKVAAAI